MMLKVISGFQAGIGGRVKKVYIAGPDVFFPDIAERVSVQKRLCAKVGVVPLHPVDQPDSIADDIYRNNVALINQADGVVANLNPFRGAEVDTGTAFEVGYAIAKGKAVVGYVSSSDSLLERVNRYSGPTTQNRFRFLVDRDGNLIENFGYHVNLMIGASCPVVVGDFEAAMHALMAQWRADK